MKVLIAIDNSGTAEKTFDWYCDNFHKDGNKIVLVHMAPQPSIYSCYSDDMSYMDNKLANVLDQEKNKISSLKHKFQDKAKERKMHADFHMQVYDGAVGEGIMKVSEMKQPDVIFVGSRGLGMMRRTVLGSVSDYLIHHSKIPVVVYPK